MAAPKRRPLKKARAIDKRTPFLVGSRVKPQHTGRRHPGRGIQVRRERAGGARQFKLHKPHWIDPFPWIPGTDPEKRIFAALVQRKIFFIFHGGSPAEAHNIALLEPDHDIDFRLPQYKLIIDPFSPFAHSQQSTVKRDARKAAIFAAAGYATYHPWAVAPGIFVLDQTEQLVADWRNGHWTGKSHESAAPHKRIVGAEALLLAMPILNGPPRYRLTDPLDIEAARTTGYRIGSHLGAGAGAVAAANHARRRPPIITIKR